MAAICLPLFQDTNAAFQRMELRKIEKEPGRLRLYQKGEFWFRHTSKKIHELDSSDPVWIWTMQLQAKSVSPCLGRHKYKPDTVVCVLYKIILEHNSVCYISIIVIGWDMTGVIVCRTKQTPTSEVRGYKHFFFPNLIQRLKEVSFLQMKH